MEKLVVAIEQASEDFEVLGDALIWGVQGSDGLGFGKEVDFFLRQLREIRELGGGGFGNDARSCLGG